ncbi:murein biosynthesis integral membrane protein MurJ [Leptobacterium sp. I13]|uniref:murein biosynthesis integral membrane protein MurJ n=1 Tax=Leptobacterium meishanense TaxID=3128904 RepID=UPI0030ED0A22
MPRTRFDSILNIIRQPIVANMLLVGIVTLAVKVISFYKETVIASTFGLSELLDTFYIAILIPSFVQNVFVGALKNLFIPNYITELHTTKQRGGFQTLGFSIIIIIVSVLIILSLIFAVYFLEFVFPGHSEAFYQLVRIQLYFALPCLYFWGASTLLEGLLEIDNKFFVATIAPVFMAIATIFCLFFLRDVLGKVVLVVGMLSGSVLGFAYLLLMAVRYKKIYLGKIRMNGNMRMMIKQLPPKIISGFLTGVNPFVDQFFAAQLVVGSIAAINYGVKIPAFAVGILILALGNVLLPHFSRLINKDLRKAYVQLFNILKMIFIGSLLLMVIAFFFSNEIIAFLFERKAFTADNTIVVGTIQKIAFVYVPFYLCTLVTVKFLTSINKNAFMAWTSFFNLIMNLILNIILVKKWGVYGLVLSTTCVYIISSFIYFGFTYRQYKLHLNEN